MFRNRNLPSQSAWPLIPRSATGGGPQKSHKSAFRAAPLFRRMVAPGATGAATADSLPRLRKRRRAKATMASSHIRAGPLSHRNARLRTGMRPQTRQSRVKL
jgi:hypothetical protein